MIVETSGWRHLKEKNQLFLSCEYQKIYHPSPKTTQLPKIAPNQNWKTLFLPYISISRIIFNKFFCKNILFSSSWYEISSVIIWVDKVKGFSNNSFKLFNLFLHFLVKVCSIWNEIYTFWTGKIGLATLDFLKLSPILSNFYMIL